jgi:hypothetical protein
MYWSRPMQPARRYQRHNMQHLDTKICLVLSREYPAVQRQRLTDPLQAPINAGRRDNINPHSTGAMTISINLALLSLMLCCVSTLVRPLDSVHVV